MNLVPNAFYIYVSDARSSASFYKALFDIEPVFESPDYVAFMISQEVSLAVWSGNSDAISQNPPRTSELGMNMKLESHELDTIYHRWIEQGATPIETPHDAIFGRTFVVADPDGNLIRVAPVD